MAAMKILPGTGRGTKTRSGLVEGALHFGHSGGRAPSTPGLRPAVPLPVNGEELL
jgi:hypothetical protein